HYPPRFARRKPRLPVEPLAVVAGDPAVARRHQPAPTPLVLCAAPAVSARLSSASASTSSKPARRLATNTSVSGTAAASTLMPMQQVPLCDTSVTITAAPGTGANGYM